MSLTTVARAALAAALTAIAIPAAAQDFPSKPITLIVPFPAGGPTDTAMRTLAEGASKHLGQPVIVENKAGGSGTVGPATMAATAKPDGYTIAQMPITVFRLPLMQETTWNAEKDFTYIVNLTGAHTPFKTWQDVVDYAKQNPGKLTYGTPGTGGSPHLGMEMIAAKSGIKLTHIPFKGSAELQAATAGGHIMLAVEGPASKQLADAGKVRFLNIWTAGRAKILPDVPTLKELGYPYVIDSPFGIAGPKGMDPKVVAKLHDAFRKSLDEPASVETMERLSMVPNYKSTADYVAFVKEQIATERALVEQLGLAKK